MILIVYTTQIIILFMYMVEHVIFEGIKDLP